MLIRLSLLAALLAPSALAQTLYVDANLTTGAGDGSSWANAFQGSSGLQDALAAAASGTDVFVADGVYLPSATGVRTASFRLQSGVRIYGGFQGGEAGLGERPPIGAFPSVLSGDLAGNDTAALATRAENTHNVVNALGANNTAVLDGFTIRGGNANSGANDRGAGILCQGAFRPLVANCRFEDNRCTFGGGAGYINNGGAPTFVGCSFVNNNGGSFGGAFDIAGGGLIVFDRCTFEGNRAARAGALEIFASGSVLVNNSLFVGNVATGSSGGGALWIGNGGTARIRSCTIVGNSATANAFGGIHVQGATPTIRNTILWANTGTGSAGNQVNTTADVDDCLVQGGFAAGTGILSADPAFVDAANGDYALAPNSPAIDAGNSGALVAGYDNDLAGGRRLFDTVGVPNTGLGATPWLDLGALEATTDIGTYFCDAVVNSTGVEGRIAATGSLAVAQNDVTLTATNLPPNQFGIFVTSQATGLTVGAGGNGTLCLGGAVGRFNLPSQILSSGTGGTFSLALDLTALPTPNTLAAALPGSSWHFQAWHRDFVFVSQTSNFTDAVRLVFE